LKRFVEGSQTPQVCEPSAKLFKRQEVNNDPLRVACATTSTGQVIRSISDSTPSATNNETATNVMDIDKDEETLQKQRAAEYMRQYRNRKATNITHVTHIDD
jgi:chemotaxis methyl-accepting protein methylase